MAPKAPERSSTKIIRVYKPKGGENWFPVHPKLHRVTRNRFVDGVRSEMAYAVQFNDGYACWNIDGRPVTTTQLAKLERAWSRKEKVRINKFLVDAHNLKAKGHVITREVLSVNDSPRLELDQCHAAPGETVQLVAKALREPSPPDPMQWEPEVVIQPVSEEEIAVRTFRLLPASLIKQEPVDSSDYEDQPSVLVETVRPLVMTENPSPKKLRRSGRRRANANYSEIRSRKRQRQH